MRAFFVIKLMIKTVSLRLQSMHRNLSHPSCLHNLPLNQRFC